MKYEISERDKLIDDYIMGLLSKQEMESFDKHCFNCDICFGELRLREEIVDIIKKEGNIIFADYLEKYRAKKPGFFHSLINKIPWFSWEGLNLWVYATTAVGAIIILCFFIYSKLATPVANENVINERYISEKQDSTQIETPVMEQEYSHQIKKSDILAETQKPGQSKNAQKEIEEQMTHKKTDLGEAFAANFETSPYLEEMITDIIRSYSIAVLSPEIGENVKGDILFNWESSGENISYLKILNNLGIELFSFRPDSNQFLFTGKLDSGLYYWKLESEDDLFFVGKFLVKQSGG